MGEVGDAYAGCRRRIDDLVRDLDDATSATPVPACPGWTVHDVVAHVTGVVDDALAGRLDGVATDPWTAAQVDARRGRPVADILDEWAAAAPTFEGMLDAIGPPGRQAVLDVATHEHDIRGALRAPGARDADAVPIGLSFLVPAMLEAARADGIALRVEAGGSAWGPDSAAVTLRAEPFEAMRALTGRRSIDQVRAMDWEGDVDPVLPILSYGPFEPHPVPLEE